MLQHTEDSTAGEEKSNFPHLSLFFLASLEACVWLGTMGAATHNGRFPFVCDESQASNSFFLLTRSIAGEYSGLCSMIDAI